jgi:hypothetical protein
MSANSTMLVILEAEICLSLAEQDSVLSVHGDFGTLLGYPASDFLGGNLTRRDISNLTALADTKPRPARARLRFLRVYLTLSGTNFSTLPLMQ